ncbi:MAG: NDP-sugar synthase [Anaerolineae bacterium]|nr:NDP-sugar synthase [Anaerolineae bacterium]
MRSALCCSPPRSAPPTRCTWPRPHLDGPFLFTACDNIVPPNHVPALIKRFDAFKGDIVLSLIEATPEEISRSANVEVEGDRVVRHVEKPPVEAVTSNLLSIMIYACSPAVLEGLDRVPVSARGEKEFAHVIARFINGGGRVSFVRTAWRLHLTQDQDLLWINRCLLDEGRDAHILSELPGSVTIRPPVRVDPRVSVGQEAHIGPNTYLEAGCTVGQGAHVSNSVVLAGGVVPAGAVVNGQIVARA